MIVEIVCILFLFLFIYLCICHTELSKSGVHVTCTRTRQFRLAVLQVSNNHTRLVSPFWTVQLWDILYLLTKGANLWKAIALQFSWG